MDTWTQRRTAVAERYQESLTGCGLVLPRAPEWAECAWHLYVVRSTDREALQAKLSQVGIGSLIHYPIPPHMQDAYAQLSLPPDALPLARQLAAEVVSLPIGPQLSHAQQDIVIATLKGLGV